jgi:hypothetical protein
MNMFIQQQCGCIGLLIENEFGSKEFYKVIDCRREDKSITFYDDSDSMEYCRYRQLNNHELHAVVKLIAQAMADADRYEEVQLALGITGSRSQQQRREAQSNWDRVCREQLTFTSFNEIDTIKAFPLDDRNQLEIDKENDRLRLLKERENKKLDHWPDPLA